MTDFISDSTTSVLAKVLDGSAERQRILADNIANVDTPGFSRREVAFEGELANALDTAGTDDERRTAAVSEVMPETTVDMMSARRMDGNNVDMEHEMSSVAKNSLQYETAAQLLTLKLSMLKVAVTEGRR